jgi:hypothetical protein
MFDFREFFASNYFLFVFTLKLFQSALNSKATLAIYPKEKKTESNKHTYQQNLDLDCRKQGMFFLKSIVTQ